MKRTWRHSGWSKEKRQRTAALQNLRHFNGIRMTRQRRGVRQSSAALAIKSKPDKLKVPSLESVQKHLSGEKVDAETAAFGRKVEKLYVQYVSKQKGPKLRKLIEQDLAAGASREQVLAKAVKAGYLEGCADDILCARSRPRGLTIPKKDRRVRLAESRHAI